MSTAVETWPLTGRRRQLSRFDEARRDGAAGVLLVGGPGVGKTRLADECLRTAERSGARVGRSIATRTAATVPLGALAPVLQDLFGADATDADPIELFLDIRRRLAAGTALAEDGARPVVLVDDLHLLDATSLTVVQQLITSDAIFLLATVRSGEATSDLATALWRDLGVVRVELGELDRVNVDTLLHLGLGGPVEAETGARLWEASRGNALFLRELVLGARDAGQLVDDGGSWRIRGDLVGSDRLIEIIGRRLDGLAAPARALIEELAVCEPLGYEDLAARTPPDVIEDVEARGFVSVTQHRRRCELRLAHPLYAEVVRSTMPTLRRRKLLLDAADRITAYGARRRDDSLRIATWRLDGDGHADPELLVRAARIARAALDYAQVARLAQAALDQVAGDEAALLLGEALYETARFDDADEVLAGAEVSAGSDHRRMLASLARAKNLFWGRLDPPAAIAVLDAAIGAVADPRDRDELAIQRASFAIFDGRPADGLDELGSLGTGGDDRSSVMRALVESPALALAGSTAAALDIAQRAFATHSTFGDQIAMAQPGTHVANQVLALTEAGRLGEAADLAAAGHEIAVEDRLAFGQVWFALSSGRVEVQRGRLITAHRWFADAAAKARSHEIHGPRRLALSGVALALAQQGDAAGARVALVEQDAIEHPFGFLGPEGVLATAWTAYAEGDPRSAEELLRLAADDAIATGHRTTAAWLLHDAARIGLPEPSVDLLAELATTSDSPLVAARSAHVQALAARDQAGLVAVADAFEAMGAALLAAEAITSATDVARSRGEARNATALAARATALRSLTEGARTPGLVRTDGVVPLSRREREIALLAATGVTSKDIADRLFVSVRTVNNHIQHIYTKLGITSRAELAGALAQADGSVPGEDDR